MQTLFFVATNGKAAPSGDPLVGDPQNFELWKLAPDGEAVIAADIIPGDAGSAPFFFTRFNNALYFSAYTPATGRELWTVASDGTISLAADLVPGTGGSDPFSPQIDDETDYTTFAYNGELYFNASTPATGRELFKVKADGSVVLVADLNPGPADSWPVTKYSYFDFNGEFYFDALAGADLGLWKVKADGSVQAIQLLPGMVLHHPSIISSPYVSFNGSIYFEAYIGGGEERLFRMAADNTIVQVTTGTTDVAGPRYLTVFDNSLYFIDSVNGVEELWRVVPNSDTAEQVKVLDPGMSAYNLRVIQGALYFSADSDNTHAGINDEALWRVDAGGALTRVAGITVEPFPEFVFNGVTYFRAHDIDHGEELWKLTPGGGVALVADINPGAASAFSEVTQGFLDPTEIVEFNGAVYFNATSAATGMELWKLAADGTVSLVRDIEPGATGSHPFLEGGGVGLTEHAVLNGELYFSAQSGSRSQLWKVKADGSVVQATDIAPGNGGTAGFYLNVLDIGGSPANNPPIVTGAVTLASIAENSGARLITQGELLGNVSDPDGPSLAATGLAIASGAGTLVDHHDGTWSYTPAAGDDTAVTFSYSVTDGIATVADSATLDITQAAPPAGAIVVTNNNDAGAGSLRAAVDQANTTAGADTIVFDAAFFTGGAANLIRLTSGAIAIGDDVTIDASAVGGVTITGDKNGNDVRVGATAITDVAASGAGLLADNSSIFLIASGADTTLQSLTLTGGRTTALGARGGAIYSESVALTLVDSTVSGNSTAGNSADGGGIFSYGTTLINSTVSGNSTAGDNSKGGGIAGLFLTLTNSTLSGNSTAGELSLGGGGFVFGNAGAFMSLTNSAVSGNFTTGANASGGGLKGSDVTLVNSTVFGNSVAGDGADGGGIQSSSTVTLTNSTVSGNAVTGSSAFGGGIESAGTVTLTNSIVLGNDNAQAATDEISGTVAANGLNIVGTGIDINPADHVINADPTLVFAQTVANGAATAGVLADNGGPVQTIALKLDASNPALDAGDDSLAPALDARGSSRVDVAGVAHNGANVSDLGAFEQQNGANAALVASADAFTLPEGGSAAALAGGATSVLANDTDADSDPLTAVLVSGPAHGTLTLNPDGTFSYTHDGSETTSDSFTYKANDTAADSAPVTVAITVTPVNDAPVVSGPVTLSAILKDSGARLITQGQLLAHAADVDGPSLTAVDLQIAAGAGSLVDNNDGTWSFTPAPADDSSVMFSYQVTDGTASVATSANVDLTSVVSGTGGDDSYDAPSGSSAFDAGPGVDTMTFSFALTEATLTWSGNQVTVQHGADQTVLSGFERFVFADGTVENNDADPLVDDLFYYAQNHDVWNAHVDPDLHYATSGWHENRDPNAFFSTMLYLSANPDVKAAGINPLTHFHQHGWAEGRIPGLDFDPRQYLEDNPDVAAAHIDPLLHFLGWGAAEGRQPAPAARLVTGDGFDFAYYLQQNPDVAAAGVDPYRHFQTTGWHEGRNPNAFFDTAGYLSTYTDVAAAGFNPLDHYNTWGWHEGRDPSTGFDTMSYLAGNPDVAAAQVNPLVHFLQHGIDEGRAPLGDGIWR